MKYIIIATILTLTTTFAIAQENSDTVKYKARRAINAEFPRTRTFNLDYDHSFSRDFDSKLYNDDFQKGIINNQKIIDFTFNIPVYQYKKWSFSVTGNYNFSQIKTSNLENTSPSYTYLPDETKEFHKYIASINTTLYSSLFKKPLIYNGSVMVDGFEEGIQRIKGIFAASLMVKRTEYVLMTVGLVAIIDPTSQIPFLPTFTYNQKFRGSKWEFDLILPQRLMLRHPVGNQARFSVATAFDGESYYFSGSSSFLTDTYEYSQLKINGGLIYEYKLTNDIVITMQGGVRKYISNRFTPKGELNRNYVYKNNQDITGYFKVGISYNPFKKIR